MTDAVFVFLLCVLSKWENAMADEFVYHLLFICSSVHKASSCLHNMVILKRDILSRSAHTSSRYEFHYSGRLDHKACLFLIICRTSTRLLIEGSTFLPVLQQDSLSFFSSVSSPMLSVTFCAFDEGH